MTETETETEIEVKESLSDPVSFGWKSSVVSAPWAHGTKPVKPLKPQIVSEPETPENGENGDFHDVAKPSNGFQREFVAESDEVSEEEREVSNEVVNGFSLDESSDYQSSDLQWKKVGRAEAGGGEKAVWKRSNTATAEKTLPEHELRRLRNVSLRMLERIKVGARGITQALVDNIHEKWKLDEVVKLKFEEPLSQNMKRTHEILEVSLMVETRNVFFFER